MSVDKFEVQIHTPKGDKTLTWAQTSKPLAFGCGTECRIRVSAASWLPHHGQFVYRDSKLFLQVNGPLVLNGEKVESGLHELGDEPKIVVGAITLSITRVSGPSSAPTKPSTNATEAAEVPETLQVAAPPQKSPQPKNPKKRAENPTAMGVEEEHTPKKSKNAEGKASPVKSPRRRSFGSIIPPPPHRYKAPSGPRHRKSTDRYSSPAPESSHPMYLDNNSDDDYNEYRDQAYKKNAKRSINRFDLGLTPKLRSEIEELVNQKIAEAFAERDKQTGIPQRSPEDIDRITGIPTFIQEILHTATEPTTGEYIHKALKTSYFLDFKESNITALLSRMQKSRLIERDNETNCYRVM